MKVKNSKKSFTYEQYNEKTGFPKFYKVDGAIAIQKIDAEFNLETSINDGKLGYVMERKYSTDIDNYLDIKIIEYYLEKEKEEEAELMR